MKLTFHGAPKAYFASLDPSQPYLPAEFGREGFIHCTDGGRAPDGRFHLPPLLD